MNILPSDIPDEKLTPSNCCPDKDCTILRRLKVLEERTKQFQEKYVDAITENTKATDHLAATQERISTTLEHLSSNLSIGFSLTEKGVRLFRFIVGVFLIVVCIQGIIIAWLTHTELNFTTNGMQVTHGRNES